MSFLVLEFALLWSAAFGTFSHELREGGAAEQIFSSACMRLLNCSSPRAICVAAASFSKELDATKPVSHNITNRLAKSLTSQLKALLKLHCTFPFIIYPDFPP